jgi:pilus assembly protein CpaB
MSDQPDLASALYKAAAPSTRRVGVRVAIFLSVSIAAAVGSALLLTRYMEARTSQVRVPMQKVVVADADLPVGTELRAENLKVIDWPATSRPEGAFQDVKELEGKVVASRVYRFEPLLPAKLAGSGKGGLSALLPAGMRAAAVKVDDVVGVAGFVQPGDSVDVIATIRTDGGSYVTSSKVILQNVSVLAVGKELDVKSRSNEKVVPATVATLMVDAEQSERLALAAAQGKILLTLRGEADTEVVPTSGVNAAALLSLPPRQQAEAKPPRRIVRAPQVAATEKPRSEVVEIMRGNLYETRKFEGASR